jgi:hypothetical protein
MILHARDNDKLMCGAPKTKRRRSVLLVMFFHVMPAHRCKACEEAIKRPALTEGEPR